MKQRSLSGAPDLSTDQTNTISFFISASYTQAKVLCLYLSPYNGLGWKEP